MEMLHMTGGLELEDQEIDMEVSPESGPGAQSGASATASKDTWLTPCPTWEQNLNFFMFEYKCSPCPLRRGCPNKICCKGWHHEGERRRNPGISSTHSTFRYSEEPCLQVKPQGSSKWLPPSRCMNGDQCQYSHTLLEQMYHPNIYKTSMCINFTHPTGNKCQWGYYCTHAHGPEDIRNPPKKGTVGVGTTSTDPSDKTQAGGVAPRTRSHSDTRGLSHQQRPINYVALRELFDRYTQQQEHPQPKSLDYLGFAQQIPEHRVDTMPAHPYYYAPSQQYINHSITGQQQHQQQMHHHGLHHHHHHRPVTAIAPIHYTTTPPVMGGGTSSVSGVRHRSVSDPPVKYRGGIETPPGYSHNETTIDVSAYLTQPIPSVPSEVHLATALPPPNRDTSPSLPRLPELHGYVDFPKTTEFVHQEGTKRKRAESEPTNPGDPREGVHGHTRHASTLDTSELLGYFGYNTPSSPIGGPTITRAEAVSKAPPRSDLEDDRQELVSRIETLEFDKQELKEKVARLEEKETQDATQLSQMRAFLTCPVCNSSYYSRNQVLVPCGHLICCNCSPSHSTNCPICDKEIDNVVYLRV